MKMLLMASLLLCILTVIYVFFDLFYSTDEKKKKRMNSFFDISICFILSLVASLQFNSFLSKYSTDSSVFAYIGKMMHKGLVPYKDLFDHKGIVLYFIQYLASFFDNISLGLWLIELANLTVFAYLTLKTIKLFTANKLTQFVSLAIICCICTQMTYEGGNFVEEYALPWLGLSMYLFFKWFKNQELKIMELLLIGSSFSVVMFLRPNMIALWVALIPIVAFTLIAQRKWLDLFKCIGWFCAGMAIVLAVLFVYFIKTNSLNDMIESYFVFNFGYVASNTDILAVIKVMIILSLWTITLIPSVLLTFIPEIKNKNKIYVYNLILIVVTLVMISMSGRVYLHYGIILIPALVLPLVLMLEKVSQFVQQRIPQKKKNNIVAQSLCIILVVVALLSAHFLETFFKTPSTNVDTVSIFLEEKTKQEDDILILGNGRKYYLTSNRSTNNKYFYQTPPINISDELYEDFMSELKSKPADYVICFGDRIDNYNHVDNLGSVYRYYEELCASREYICCEYENFYVYQKVR